MSGYITSTGRALTIGTPHYLSPEQAQGREIDGRADLYSLGITLYRGATGLLPFRSRDWWELARMHVEVPPEPPRRLRPDLSRHFERIILRCLAKHPDDRYQTAEALADELDALATPDPGGNSGPESPAAESPQEPDDAGPVPRDVIPEREDHQRRDQ